MNGWRLGRRETTSAGEVAWEVFGEGPPLVLVHGTPMRSYLWRNIVPALAEHHSVYVYDLLGYGESEKGVGQDVSIVAQARVLRELIEARGLDAPAIAGHDIGGGIVLRAHLLEGVSFSRIAVLDAVVLTPLAIGAEVHNMARARVRGGLRGYAGPPFRSVLLGLSRGDQHQPWRRGLRSLSGAVARRGRAASLREAGPPVRGAPHRRDRTPTRLYWGPRTCGVG